MLKIIYIYIIILIIDVYRIYMATYINIEGDI